MNKDIYQQVDRDPTKRHFVFGDIHGRYDTFLALLQSIEYDENTDVLYSVGDIIDRGPKSVELIEFWTNHPNRHVARGNHEQMVVNPDRWFDVWMYYPNGGPATVQSCLENGKSKEWLAEWCTSLPLVLDVGDDNDPDAFRIVHAEVPRLWSEDHLMMMLSTVAMGESELLWGRACIKEALDNVENMKPAAHGIEYNDQRNPRKVISGHTPLMSTIITPQAAWIDTGRARRLTCYEPTLGMITTQEFVEKP